jgi:hypothetical protein
MPPQRDIRLADLVCMVEQDRIMREVKDPLKRAAALIQLGKRWWLAVAGEAEVAWICNG